MDIREAVKMKKDLEKDIRSLILMFEEETELSVEDVIIFRTSTMGGSNCIESLTTNIPLS